MPCFSTIFILTNRFIIIQFFRKEKVLLSNPIIFSNPASVISTLNLFCKHILIFGLMACCYANINWLRKGKTKKLKSLNVENDLVKDRMNFWIHVHVKIMFFLFKKKSLNKKSLTYTGQFAGTFATVPFMPI